MKRIAVILLSLALAAMLMLSGCGDNAQPAPALPDTAGQAAQEPAPEDNVTPADSSEPAQPSQPEEQAEAADCELQFRSAPERSDGDFSKVYEINCGGEYAESSYVWCDAEMTDFECVSVEMDEDFTYYTRTGTYSRIDSVKPGEAVYITIELPEIIPNAAFIYKAGGREYIRLIGYNGRDGGMALYPPEEGQFRNAE